MDTEQTLDLRTLSEKLLQRKLLARMATGDMTKPRSTHSSPQLVSHLVPSVFMNKVEASSKKPDTSHGGSPTFLSQLLAERSL